MIRDESDICDTSSLQTALTKVVNVGARPD